MDKPSSYERRIVKTKFGVARFAQVRRSEQASQDAERRFVRADFGGNSGGREENQQW
jgi:hypothetical protein